MSSPGHGRGLGSAARQVLEPSSIDPRAIDPAFQEIAARKSASFFGDDPTRIVSPRLCFLRSMLFPVEIHFGNLFISIMLMSICSCQRDAT